MVINLRPNAYFVNLTKEEQDSFIRQAENAR